MGILFTTYQSDNPEVDKKVAEQARDRRVYSIERSIESMIAAIPSIVDFDAKRLQKAAGGTIVRGVKPKVSSSSWQGRLDEGFRSNDRNLPVEPIHAIKTATQYAYETQLTGRTILDEPDVAFDPEAPDFEHLEMQKLKNDMKAHAADGNYLNVDEAQRRVIEAQAYEANGDQFAIAA